MPSTVLPRLTALDPALFPADCEPLEEIAAAQPADAAAALGFGLARMVGAGAKDRRPMAMVTTSEWLRERGRPFHQGLVAWGLAPERLIWIRTEREGEALWALEEVLKSGAVAAALATIEAPAFVATRRVDFAARAGGAVGLLIRARAATDLSAARRRWRITAVASGENQFDSLALGAVRLRAELARRRDGPPGAWNLERDDETGGLRVVAGLAGHGVETRPAAGVRAA